MGLQIWKKNGWPSPVFWALTVVLLPVCLWTDPCWIWGLKVWCPWRTVKSLVYKKKRRWKIPGVRRVWHVLPNHTFYCLSVRKSVILWQMEFGRMNWVSFLSSSFGMITVKAELKSTRFSSMCQHVCVEMLEWTVGLCLIHGWLVYWVCRWTSRGQGSLWL